MGSVVTKRAPSQSSDSSSGGPGGGPLSPESRPTTQPSRGSSTPAPDVDPEQSARDLQLCLETDADSAEGSSSTDLPQKTPIQLEWAHSPLTWSTDAVAPSSPATSPSKGRQIDFGALDLEAMWGRGRRVGRGAFSEARLCLAQVGSGLFFVAKRVTLNALVPEAAAPAAAAAAPLRELAILQRLAHGHVVPLFGYRLVPNPAAGTTALFLCMEYMAGGSLHDLVRQFGPLRVTVLRSYLEQMAAGLEYLHDNGVLHRDLKPHNVLLHALSAGAAPIVKLADFGAAKLQVDAGDVSCMSVGAQFTPAYSAPEVFRGECCAASDVWSLGLCVLEMATSEHPWKFSAVTSNTDIICVLAQKRGPQLPPTLAPSVRAFIEECIAWDHAGRPSAAQLRAHPLLTCDAGALEPSPPAPSRPEAETEIGSTVDTYSSVDRCRSSATTCTTPQDDQT